MRQSSRCRLKVLASHPIQYFTPIYRLLATHPLIDLEVLYCRDFGVREQFDKQFGQRIRWDTDQLSGYRHRFLWNASPIVDTFNPLHAVNPGAFTRVLVEADAVWINGYTYPSNWFAIAAAALRNAAVLVRSDMRLDPDRVPHRLDRLRDRVIRSWVRQSDALLYVGSENRLAYRHYGAQESRLFFSPYSVDVEAMENGRRHQVETDNVRRSWQVTDHRLIVLFVGKLTTRKHPEAALNLASAPGLRENIHVVIAGSGPLEGSMRARAAAESLDNVTFLGFVNQSELPAVYGAADVFVMPSEREPWGLVLNEAMCAGTVPIVSDGVGAAPDLIIDQQTGFVFPTGRWDILQQLVGRLVADTALRGTIARNANAHARQYSHDAAARGIVAALTAIGRLPAKLPEVAESLQA